MKNVLGIVLMGATLLAGSAPVAQTPEPCVCQCQCVIDACGGGGTVVYGGGGDSSSTITKTIIHETVIEDSGEITISNNKVNFHPHINNVGNNKVKVQVVNNNNKNGGGKKGKK